MQVLFKSPVPPVTALRHAAERRLRFVLRRLVALVPRATVQLSELDPARGAPGKRCQLELETSGAGKVAVTAVAADWAGAIDTALARAARLLARAWQHGRGGRRVRLALADAQAVRARD